MKSKIHILVSVDAKKTSDKTQIFFMIKILSKLCVNKAFLYTIKVIYDKHIAGIILNGDKSKAFPLRSKIKVEIK